MQLRSHGALTETEAHRKERIASSIHAGIRNPENVYLVAKSYLRCHTAAAEQLVNIGGHLGWQSRFRICLVEPRAGSPQLCSHRRQVERGQQSRAFASHVCRGMIAELEAGLRATAVATEKATYGVTAAKRTARAPAKLKSVAAKVNTPLLDEILSEFAHVKLKLNNSNELTGAADRIARLGFAFADQVHPLELAPMDAFVPSANRWK